MVKVLLIGSTGFIGKVTLERLLHDGKVEKVYILLRGKANTTPTERFHALSTSPCFSKCTAAFHNIVVPITGDLSVPNLGLAPNETQLLRSQLTHIINLAASVDFNMTLKEAFAANVVSSLNVLEFAKTCHNLERLCHCSTAYVLPSEKGARHEERLPVYFRSRINAKKVFTQVMESSADVSREEELRWLQESNHNNTYSFSKAMAEVLLSQQKEKVNLVIVRPSIVSASRLYPCPGWIDSINAVAGYVFLYGGGFLHCRLGAVENSTKQDFVPCDYVAYVLLRSTFDSRSSKVTPIINATVGHEHSCTTVDVDNISETFFKVKSRRVYLKPFFRNKKGYNSMDECGKKLEKDQRRLKIIKSSMKLLGLKNKAKTIGKLIPAVKTCGVALYPYAIGSWNFQSSHSITEFDPTFTASSYLRDNVCEGVLHHLLRRKKYLPKPSPLVEIQLPKAKQLPLRASMSSLTERTLSSDDMRLLDLGPVMSA